MGPPQAVLAACAMLAAVAALVLPVAVMALRLAARLLVGTLTVAGTPGCHEADTREALAALASALSPLAAGLATAPSMPRAVVVPAWRVSSGLVGTLMRAAFCPFARLAAALILVLTAIVPTDRPRRSLAALVVAAKGAALAAFGPRIAGAVLRPAIG